VHDGDAALRQITLTACNYLDPADESDGGVGDSRRRDEHQSVVDRRFPASFAY